MLQHGFLALQRLRAKLFQAEQSCNVRSLCLAGLKCETMPARAGWPLQRRSPFPTSTRRPMGPSTGTSGPVLPPAASTSGRSSRATSAPYTARTASSRSMGFGGAPLAAAVAAAAAAAALAVVTRSGRVSPCRLQLNAVRGALYTAYRCSTSRMWLYSSEALRRAWARSDGTGEPGKAWGHKVALRVPIRMPVSQNELKRCTQKRLCRPPQKGIVRPGKRYGEVLRAPSCVWARCRRGPPR